MRYFLQQESDFRYLEVDKPAYFEIPKGYTGNRFRVSNDGMLWHIEVANGQIGDLFDGLKLAGCNLG